MRQWALDLEHLAILRNRLTTTEAELEVSRGSLLRKIDVI
jgi:hypothetical protein